MFWFLELKSYPPFQYSAFYLSLLTSLFFILVLRFHLFSCIHSKEACRWMASLISLCRYFWFSVRVERSVNAFINVITVYADLIIFLYVSIMILLMLILHQFYTEHNFCHVVSLDFRLNYRLLPRVASKWNFQCDRLMVKLSWEKVVFVLICMQCHFLALLSFRKPAGSTVCHWISSSCH